MEIQAKKITEAVTASEVSNFQNQELNEWVSESHFQTVSQSYRLEQRLLSLNDKLQCADSFRPHYGPGLHSASNRNEYQEYFLGVKAAGA